MFCVVLIGSCNQEPMHEEINHKQIGDPWFEEVSSLLGVEFQYESGARGEYYIPEVIGGAPALIDWDNDGDLDLYLVQGNTIGPIPRLEIGNVLYENVDGHFVDRSEGSGADDKGYGIGVATGDYDNDGDVDIYVTNVGTNALLRNDGGGHFTDVAKEAGVESDGFSSCAAFADLDADGDLDLVVTSYLNWSHEDEQVWFDLKSNRTYCNPVVYDAPVHDSLYLNNGDGTFQDVTNSSGFGSVVGTGLGVVITQLTEDTMPDIFIANDDMPDRLWVNNGGGVFTEEGTLRNIAVDDSGKAKAGMGVNVVDIDHDGDVDVYVTNIFGETDSFYRNEGAYFEDITRRMGVAAETRAYTRWGIVFQDFNNDGRVDLFETTGGVVSGPNNYSEIDPLAEPNLLFEQNENGRFTVVKPQGGTAELLVASSHGVAAGDIDGDGGVDLVIVNKDSPISILRNVVKNRGNWISFRVRDRNGADAIGATIEFLMMDGTKNFKQVMTSRGYASSQDPRVHIGLGDQKIQIVTIRWTDGSERDLTSPEMNKVHDIQYVE